MKLGPGQLRSHVVRFSVLALVLGVQAGAVAQAQSPSAAEVAFERFKSLAGTWSAESTKGWSTEDMTFEVLARGSVVMSRTVFEDAPENTMVTLFSLDGDKLVLTHYCEARNQPHLMATEINADATALRFAFQRGGNMVSRDVGHMDSSEYRFVDGNEFTSKWSWYQDGKEDWMEEIHYRRLR